MKGTGFESFITQKINRTSNWIKEPFDIDITSFDPTNLYEIAYAWILQDLEKFYVDIKEIRKLIDLKKYFSYPPKTTLETLFDLQKNLKPNHQDILNSKIRELSSKLRGLPLNWQFSLKVLVLTNRLPVIDSFPFVLYDPNERTPTIFYDEMDVPKIIFQSRFTIKGLIDWLDNKNQRDWLHRVSERLPKLEFKIKQDDLVRFRIIFTLIEHDNKSARETARLLPKIYKKFGLDQQRVSELNDKQISALYDKYKGYLKRIYEGR